ncbi:hypothetical protein AXG93_4697s1120 [Marchantia polymorpha subsp. ruderalis]|uniref:Coiled-coil domain-containing protein 39 n=1 Tax=Marchantia polymorpha subsp. ruderalis TaxID=1480154 RepID=A0A176VRH5_MARPO|nr:hypothetical protein AXG93_4697s1120 [Marchantia polymorpha subsp. ruderalis]
MASSEGDTSLSFSEEDTGDSPKHPTPVQRSGEADSEKSTMEKGGSPHAQETSSDAVSLADEFLGQSDFAEFLRESGSPPRSHAGDQSEDSLPGYLRGSGSPAGSDPRERVKAIATMSGAKLEQIEVSSVGDGDSSLQDAYYQHPEESLDRIAGEDDFARFLRTGIGEQTESDFSIFLKQGGGYNLGPSESASLEAESEQYPSRDEGLQSTRQEVYRESPDDYDWSGNAEAKDDESEKSDEKEKAVKELLLLKAINSKYLPAFANEENIILHDTVLEAEIALKRAEEAVEEQDDRAAIMEEHMKRVQQEIVFSQSRHEAKRREIATEEHLFKMSSFETGRLKAEMVKMAKEAEEIANRLRQFRTSIFQANEKMDQFRLLMHWNQEELEQWAQAAKQKDEDNIAMEKYTKSDDVRIYELQQEEVKAATELSNLQQALDAEVTETQSYQIQLDKTAILFRELHLQRQKVIRMWETTVEAIHARDESIHQVAEEFAENKLRVQRKKHQLDALQKALFKEMDTNKDLERMILDAEHEVVKERTLCYKEIDSSKGAEEMNELMKMNHLRAQAELAVQIAMKKHAEEDVEVKKKKVVIAKERHERALKKVEEENDHLDTLEKRSQELGKLLTREENKVKEAKREVADLQDQLFKSTEELHALREAEKETLHEITGGKSQIKHLSHNITHLELNMTRQEEVLYTLEFQIQSLERKVARASGERSDLEEQETTKKIKDLEKELDDKKHEEALVDSQLKRTKEELRATVRKNEEAKKKLADITQKNSELSLECDTGLIEVKASQRDKEEKMLDHDLLQMEVNRLSDILNMKAEGVLTMESIKQKLIFCMEDHKREINARREKTKAQLKIIHDELHNLMMQRKKLILQIDKLQKKYQTLISRVKMEDGTVRSANYYVIKAAQDRQMLENEVPKLEEEVQKVKQDVRLLEKATDEIKESNNALRCSLNTPRSIELAYEQKILKQAYQQAKERTRFKQREEAALLEELHEAERSLENSEKERITVDETIRELEKKVETARKEAADQAAKFKRATTQLQKLARDVRDSGSELIRIEQEMQLVEARETVKDVLYKLKAMAVENADAAEVIEAKVRDAGLKLPTGVCSARSSRSSSSSGSSSASSSSRSSQRGPPSAKRPLAQSILTMDLGLDDL